MAKILIIEDNDEMAGLIELMLGELGHESVRAGTIAEAEKLVARGGHALITLDIHLPDGDGFEYCVKLRKKHGVKTPIVMLTTEISAESVIKGLDSGADDYLKKPIDAKELQARLRGHLREAAAAEKTLQFSGLKLDLDTRIPTYKGRRIDLTGRQFDILAYLIRRPEVVISRAQMIESLGRELDLYDRTIDSHVSQLRKRLKDEGVTGFSISSVYGVGYRVE